MSPLNRGKLLGLYNEIYEQERIPDHFNEATVVQIYETGKSQKTTRATDP